MYVYNLSVKYGFKRATTVPIELDSYTVRGSPERAAKFEYIRSGQNVVRADGRSTCDKSLC